MVRWLGEHLTLGQFLIAAAQRVAHGAPARSRNSDQFNAMPGMLSRWSLSSLSSDGLRQRHSATSVGPAEPRQRWSVLSRLCQSPAASLPHPVLVS